MLDIVQQISKPGDIADLFDFLRKLPENEVSRNNEEAICRVKCTLGALHLDRRHPPSVSATFHRRRPRTCSSVSWGSRRRIRLRTRRAV